MNAHYIFNSTTDGKNSSNPTQFPNLNLLKKSKFIKNDLPKIGVEDELVSNIKNNFYT